MPTKNSVLAPRILVIDDDPSSVDMFARVLSLEGYLVSKAMDAEEGLREVTTAPPDAILLDLKMPNVDGLAFLRRLRALEADRTTPVAVVTGVQLLDEPLRAELDALGAELRFKPLWFEELIMLVQRLLQR